MITAPYNFVPLNKEIFYPKWHNKVSHDIPFEDGKSGEITVEIRAESPIFIRDNIKENEFCSHNNIKYIPGSSIKGVIRTILEIISFSKLKLEDKVLSYRDLNNPSYKKKAMNSEKIYMGWLYKNNGMWQIDSVGKISTNESRIKYIQMKNHLGEKIVNKIKKTKEAYKKYKSLDSFESLKIDAGTIVFTGSTGNKTREFLFPNNVEECFILSDENIKTFKEAYYIGTTNESADWKNLWANRFKQNLKIPIFFQLDDNKKIKHFGLSMLYKLPYENSLQTLVDLYQGTSNDKDLAETIFGYTNDDISLKGRVQFSHFKCVEEKKYEKEVTLPLSSPRATFYPNYIVQNEKNGTTNNFLTYDNIEAIPRGFKLYPPRKNIITSDKACIKNPKICTPFKPLNSGSIFNGIVRFHNLKEVEIGALIASLTLLNTKDSFHKIGMAKPYGFGTVSIKVKKLTTTKDTNHYIQCFINYINNTLDIDILNHPRIKAFLKLSSYSFSDEELKYMDIKEFAKAKKPQNRFVLSSVVNEKTVKDVMNNLKQKKELSEELSISNTKMSKVLTSSWRRVFKINFIKPHIYAFKNKKMSGIKDEQQLAVYTKLSQSKYFNLLASEICNFFDKNIDNQRTQELYEKIKKLK